MRFKKKELPYDLATPLLGIYTRENHNSKDTRTPTLTAAQFTIVRIWTQPRCPSREGWIKTMWHACTRKYYSAIKRNEIRSFVEMWMDPETLIQSEVSQKEKNKYAITDICEI